MAVERTTRLRVYTWSDDGDEFTRDQMTTSHEVLEERVAQFFSFPGLPSGEENPAARLRRSFHLDSTSNVLYFYDTNDTWRALNAYAAPPTTLVPSPTATPVEGSALTYARSDHSHPMLPWATMTQPVGTASSAGTNNTYTRADHVHVIGTGAINNSTMLDNSVVVATKIAAGAVETQKIAVNAVTKDRLAVDQQLPTGMIAPFAGASAPTGWVLCDGADYDPTDGRYVALYEVIGISYGQAGSNFRVPDLSNRVPQGAGTTARGVSAGGSATITETHLPPHGHGAGTYITATEAAHQHGLIGLTTATSGAHNHTVNTNGAHDHGLLEGHRIVRETTIGSPFKLAFAESNATLFYAVNGVTTSTFRTHDGHIHSTATEPAHTHALTGNVGAAGSHNHVISGTSASTGSGLPLPVSTAHVGVNYIIKL